jgi:hypothetical protein
MKRALSSLVIRWMVLILTTWCLNSDIAEAAIGGQSHSSASVTVVQSTVLHSSFLRDRCDCHRGTVLPLAPIEFASETFEPASVPQSDLRTPQSLSPRPNPRPPSLDKL